MHIFVDRLTIIGSDNGLSPDRRQTIIWTNAETLLIGPLGTNFSEIVIGIYAFSFRKMHMKMSSGKWRPFCLGLNVLTLQLMDVALVQWVTTGMPHSKTLVIDFNTAAQVELIKSWQINTLTPRQNGRYSADNIFTCIFLYENCCILVAISLKFIARGPVDNNPALV